MIKVKFAIKVEGDASDNNPLLDGFEVQEMLDHTRAQINKHIQTALGNMHCDTHGELASVTVNGVYSLETEQLEVSYHVDTCCKPFLFKAVMELNR